MFLRVFFVVILVIFCSSCDRFSLSKKQQLLDLDTIINFNEVDFSPSFKICDSIIEKEAKSYCFRTTIHQKIGAELQKQVFTIQDSIDEIVNVSLIIDSKGKIQYEKMDTSEIIKNQLPELDSVLSASIQKIPAIYPAIKRGIPVTTKYTLPIRIQLKE
ncbi:MAG: hypothetical protein GW772_02095 [Flavobacteriia bacterium]|nr:hypothetical protein [Flavobacteriia bacterium]OIP46096.1 MAG: hypothetical protein AUK46_09850 [Flavobacteriaceae bacterium CG2_30_31_66]PIV96900.1 MAG: hypothetical protein COW43_05610 [Flavobacteriaceae bacterium CG17_big_fil_post_rev_8_21_14_2_50_31_13]PIX13397.1 MAG: hypothetical protein COZ74_06530 [Flavobacteriaceae bacterium CG_4_8_14_3_um_filter_31_8]PIY15206.1 MAG: hypothetical protein COZ16_05005 [Flavobacteriaceae bacterium CG_4_10_14_3_um_filter_31_253]PIZ10641.1 MAG: hypotheti